MISAYKLMRVVRALTRGHESRLRRSDIVVIGKCTASVHDWGVKRLRILVSLLGCLAAIMAILPVATLAWTPTANAMPTHLAASPVCPHCHDCDPCQTANATCVQVCVSPLPTLGAAGPVLPGGEASDDGEPGHLAVLQGLSPPPEPFPPRS